MDQQERQARTLGDLFAMSRDRLGMTSDELWDGPVCDICRGKGEILYVSRNRWLTTRCESCYGTGFAEGKPPRRHIEDGVSYDPETHGCPLCLGTKVILSGRVPCPNCSR